MTFLFVLIRVQPPFVTLSEIERKRLRALLIWKRDRRERQRMKEKKN